VKSGRRCSSQVCPPQNLLRLARGRGKLHNRDGGNGGEQGQCRLGNATGKDAPHNPCPSPNRVWPDVTKSWGIGRIRAPDSGLCRGIACGCGELDATPTPTNYFSTLPAARILASRCNRGKVREVEIRRSSLHARNANRVPKLRIWKRQLQTAGACFSTLNASKNRNWSKRRSMITNLPNAQTGEAIGNLGSRRHPSTTLRIE
jgi:hypothetical protein